MNEPYKYTESLNSSQFRLLELQAGKDDDEIVVKLATYRLRNAKPYEALSYEWGKAEEGPVRISCSGKDLRITPRLMDALRHLRRSHEPRTLWVDAICIDQENISEKNEQVPEMARIYARASTVVVWLGASVLPSDRMQDAFDMLAVLAKLYVKRAIRFRSQGPRLPRLSAKEYNAPILRNDDKQLWKMLWNIISRSYFTRVWMVQEIATASKIEVVCGHFKSSWKVFSEAAAYITLSDYHLHESCELEAGLARVSSFQKMRNLYQGIEQHLSAKSHKGTFGGELIKYIFVSSMFLEATKGHDKVYAFLGFLNHLRTSPLLCEVLKVDYRKPGEELSRRLAQAAICLSKDLAICHFQDFSWLSRRNGLPSWAPDWSQTYAGALTYNWRYHNMLRLRLPGLTKFSQNADVMHTPGARLDTIRYVSETIPTEDPLPHIEVIMEDFSFNDVPKNPSKRWCLRTDPAKVEAIVSQLKTTQYRNGQSKYEALWRTLIANTADHQKADIKFERHFDAVISSIRLRAKGVRWEQYKMCDPLRMDLGSYLRIMLDSDAEMLFHDIIQGAVQAFYKELVNSIDRRVFIMTEQGFIGVATATAERGDLVVVLQGGLQPFVLQQKGNFWEMKGDVYVHGLDDRRLHAQLEKRACIYDIC